MPSPAPAELVQSELAPAPSKASKPKKRSRGMGPPFNEVLYAQSGRKLDVKLEVPSADEECPLTLSPIADDALEFLQPTTTYFTAFPEVKKMTLPCGHSFGALSIIYHFARRNMLCPCCRAGVDARLSSHCVPSSFRKTLLSKVQRELREDSNEQVESDRRAASSLVHADATSLVYIVETRLMFSDVTIDGTINLNMRFLNYNESRPALATFNIPLVMRLNASNSNLYTFFLGTGSVRGMINSLLSDLSVSALELCSVMDMSTGREVEIANSGTIVLDRSQNRDVFTILAEGDSHFYLEVLEGASRLAKLEWTAPVHMLQSIR